MHRVGLKNVISVVIALLTNDIETPAISSYDLAVAKLKSEMRKMKDKIKRVDLLVRMLSLVVW